MLSSSESPVSNGLFLGMRKLAFSFLLLSGSAAFLVFLALADLLDLPAEIGEI